MIGPRNGNELRGLFVVDGAAAFAFVLPSQSFCESLRTLVQQTSTRESVHIMWCLRGSAQGSQTQLELVRARRMNAWGDKDQVRRQRSRTSLARLLSQCCAPPLTKYKWLWKHPALWLESPIGTRTLQGRTRLKLITESRLLRYVPYMVQNCLPKYWLVLEITCLEHIDICI